MLRRRYLSHFVSVTSIPQLSQFWGRMTMRGNHLDGKIEISLVGFARDLETWFIAFLHEGGGVGQRHGIDQLH